MPENMKFATQADLDKYIEDQVQELWVEKAKEAEGKSGEMMNKAFEILNQVNTMRDKSEIRNWDKRFKSQALQSERYRLDCSKWICGLVHPETKDQGYKDAVKRIEDADGEAGTIARERVKVLTAGGAGTGAEFVPTGFRDEIWMRVGAYNVMRQVSTVMPVAGKMTLPSSAARANAYYTGENVAPAAASGVATANATLDPERLVAYDTYSKKWFLMSGIDVTQFLAKKFAEAIAYKECYQFTNGTGVAMPNGFTAVGYAAVSSVAMAGATLAYGDLISLEDDLDAKYWPYALYMFSKKGFTETKKLVDTTGQPIWTRAAEGEPAQVNGYKYVVNECISETYGTSGAYTTRIYFGDFEAYHIGDLQVLTMGTSDSAGTDDFIKDNIKLKIVSYNDGLLLDEAAINYLTGVPC